jgi:hypothetical protein
LIGRTQGLLAKACVILSYVNAKRNQCAIKITNEDSMFLTNAIMLCMLLLMTTATKF